MRAQLKNPNILKSFIYQSITTEEEDRGVDKKVFPWKTSDFVVGLY